MGGTSRWDADAWTSYSTKTKAAPAAKIFTCRSLHEQLDPKNITVRESRDSDINPASNAIIVAVDVTGSMGMIADYFVKTGLGILFTEILDRKPVSDPHLMVMGIGDVVFDNAPLQASQFECDITIAEWLEKIYVEGGGGGNNSESYQLPLYFAAHKTSIDCFEKRGKKGYLFTIGDEFSPPVLTRAQITKALGDSSQVDLTYEELLDAASKMYEVYHIIVAEGNCARSRLPQVKEDWVKLLGQRAVVLTDYMKLSEVIVSLIQLNEGSDREAVIASWSGDTSLVVRSATSDITTTSVVGKTGIVEF